MLFSQTNDLKQYAVVDDNGKVVEYFRLWTTARRWIRENKADYVGSELKIIENNKL